MEAESTSAGDRDPLPIDRHMPAHYASSKDVMSAVPSIVGGAGQCKAGMVSDPHAWKDSNSNSSRQGTTRMGTSP